MRKSRTIEGVVVSTGGVSDGRTERWDHVFLLCPWRETGGSLSKKRLRVVMPAKNHAAITRARRWAGKMAKLAVSELREHSRRWPYGLARGTFPPRPLRPDGLLSHAQAEQERPRVFHDAVLGKLSYETTTGLLVGRFRLARATGRLHVTVADIDIDDARAVARLLARCRVAFAGLESVLKAVKERIAKDLLATYNDNWRTGATLDKGAFLAQLRVSCISLSRERSTIYFEAGRLFQGHAVEVRLSPTGTVREVCLAG